MYLLLINEGLPPVSEGPPNARHVPIFILWLLEQLDPGVWDCHGHPIIKPNTTLSDRPEINTDIFVDSLHTSPLSQLALTHLFHFIHSIAPASSLGSPIFWTCMIKDGEFGKPGIQNYVSDVANNSVSEPQIHEKLEAVYMHIILY